MDVMAELVSPQAANALTCGESENVLRGDGGEEGKEWGRHEGEDGKGKKSKGKRKGVGRRWEENEKGMEKKGKKQ